MNIILDITKSFNGVIDYVNMEVHPIIYLNFPSDISGKYSFELMNFRLTLDDNICKQLKNYNPICKDIIECNFFDKSIFIYGKAKFIIDGVKGADIEFVTEDDFINGKKLYYTWDYNLQKGDYAYVCGGYTSFVPWFTTLYIIADKMNHVRMEFLSDEYVLIDSYDDSYAKSKETKNIYTNKKGKLFDFNFINTFFPKGIEKPALD